MMNQRLNMQKAAPPKRHPVLPDCPINRQLPVAERSCFVRLWRTIHSARQLLTVSNIPKIASIPCLFPMLNWHTIVKLLLSFCVNPTSGVDFMIHNAFLNPFDTTVYHFINGFAGKNHVIDSIAIFFAKDAIEIYAVLFVLAWFVLPKRDIKNRHALVMAGLSGILALLINVIISHIWFRPRPFLTIPHHTELVAHSADASFPSDHTSGSFGFAAGSWGRQQKWISWLFTIIAVLVMIARVFVGVHYPTDVIGGMIVGIIASQIMWRFSKLIFPISNAIAKLFRFGLLDKAGSKSQIQDMSE